MGFYAVNVAARWQQSEVTIDDTVPVTDGVSGHERASGRLFTTWLTAEDGVDHAITDEMMAAGIQSRTGRFATVCREIVSAAFLVVPPGRRCPQCRSAVTPEPARPQVRKSSRRQVRAWLRNLLETPQVRAEI
jgi:hypothetical protein